MRLIVALEHGERPPERWAFAGMVDRPGHTYVPTYSRIRAVALAARLWHRRWHILHAFGLTATAHEGGGVRPGKNGCRWCAPWACYAAEVKMLRSAELRPERSRALLEGTHKTFWSWAKFRYRMYVSTALLSAVRPLANSHFREWDVP